LAVTRNIKFLRSPFLSFPACLRYGKRANPQRSKLLFQKDLQEAEQVWVDQYILTPTAAFYSAKSSGIFPVTTSKYRSRFTQNSRGMVSSFISTSHTWP